MLQFVCREKITFSIYYNTLLLLFILWTSGIGTLLYVEMCVQVTFLLF